MCKRETLGLHLIRQNDPSRVIIIVFFCFCICWYVIVGTERPTCAITDSLFVFWGKWWSISASGIPRRLSPSLQAPRWYPQRSFGQWPRDYIFCRCARGGAAEGGSCPPNSLVQSHGANQLRRELRKDSFFFSELKIMVYEIKNFSLQFHRRNR